MALTTLNMALSNNCQRRRCRVSGNNSGTQANAVPTSMPPPKPCSTRPATSQGMLWASAQVSDASMKITVATSTNGLRP
ncbi:hypothetical protein D3C76_1053410 [compost metagenome]